MSPEAVTASKEMVGLFVEVPIELKTAIKTYCDTTGRSIRWVVERGVRQIIDVDAEQVPLCVRGKMYLVPRDMALEYERVINAHDG